VPVNYPEDDHHKGPGGSPDLVFTAPQKTDEEPRCNGRIKSLGGGAPGGYAESHGQRQGYDTHGKTGNAILPKGTQGIFLSVLFGKKLKGPGDKIPERNQIKRRHRRKYRGENYPKQVLNSLKNKKGALPTPDYSLYNR
jgi:hypothetical protein